MQVLPPCGQAVLLHAWKVGKREELIEQFGKAGGRWGGRDGGKRKGNRGKETISTCSSGLPGNWKLAVQK